MTLQEIKALVAYNRWANQYMFDALSQLPSEDYIREMHSSHGGLHGTLTHIVRTEKGWLSRWLRSSEMTGPASSDVAARLASNQPGSLSDVRAYWENTCDEMTRFLDALNVEKLNQTFTMTNPSGETYTASYWQMIQHVVDHSSYHRGQIVTMLRQLGVKPPPQV